MARSLEGIAAVCSRTDPPRALQLVAAAAALREAAAAPLPPMEKALLARHLASARQIVGHRRAAALITEAKAMSLDGAVGLALSAGVYGLTDATLSGAAHADQESGLTDREIEVLQLVAAGKSNKEIANELVLSVRTVERHISNVYSKIGAGGRADATAYAFRHGLT